MNIREQVRSIEHVKKLGEVFTAEREVKAMLDLIPREELVYGRVLEPACGHGNFLIEILRRKLYGRRDRHFVNAGQAVLSALMEIYGIAIDVRNVDEARARMRAECIKYWPFDEKRDANVLECVDIVLENNIVVGDFLEPDKIVFPIWVLDRINIRLTAPFFPLPLINCEDTIATAILGHEGLVALRDRRRLAALLDSDPDPDDDDRGL
jgi:hypothetical protein